MVNYQNGKIYKLWSDQSDCFYIGSTTRPLYKRLYFHKADIKRGATKTHIDMLNHTNIRIELIETFPCNSRDELLAREGHFIRLDRDKLLNRNIAGRTDQQYYEENKEKESNRKKEWRKANIERILVCDKNYREVNKEKIAKRAKEYHEVNRAVILNRQKEYREAKKLAV